MTKGVFTKEFLATTMMSLASITVEYAQTALLAVVAAIAKQPVRRSDVNAVIRRLRAAGRRYLS
jgi:hypothetical protein